MKTDSLYRIQVFSKGKWRLGKNDYTFEEAIERQKKLSEVGIRSRVVHKAELF